MITPYILPQKFAHTPDHVRCPACEGAEPLEQQGIPQHLTFALAFQIWIDQRVISNELHFTKVHYVSERTERDLRQYARAAGKFFNHLALDSIHHGHLHAYQKARALNFLLVSTAAGVSEETRPWENPAGADLIRKEVQTVVRVLRAARLWGEDDDKDLELVSAAEKDVPKAMTPQDQHHWLQICGKRTEWRLIYCWSIVALQTTAATNEMRALRLGDIFLQQGTMQIRSEGAKNRFRIRTIPLQTPEVTWALGELIERAGRLGAKALQHYLFPLHITADRYDPLQPMTVWGIRKPWDAVKLVSGLDWVTPYSLRHTSITRMAEAGVPIQVIMSFAGHISERMQRHYTTISMQAKRRWMAAAFAGQEMPYTPGFGYTFAPPEARQDAQHQAVISTAAIPVAKLA